MKRALVFLVVVVLLDPRTFADAALWTRWVEDEITERFLRFRRKETPA